MKFSKIVWTAVLATFLGAASFQGAFAEEKLQGMIPPGGAAVVVLPPNAHLFPRHVLLKFLFSAPASTQGGYSIAFCVGPASNPCGEPTSYVIQVTGGTSSFALIDSDSFVANELVVAQGTNATVPFSVSLE
jgi:hypothetical protein